MTETPRTRMFTSADAYDRYVGRYSRQLARELMALSHVQATDRVLDVGCGPGALTGELVALLGSDRVAAIDPSASFVEVCRERFPGVQVAVAAAESIPFEDGSFDAALAQLVVHFMTDADAGVAEMKRVTRQGGTLAAATWDYEGEMLLLRRFWDAAVAVDPGSRALDERHMRYCTPDGLEGLWRDAGLADVAVGPVTVAAQYESFDDLWQPFEKGVGPAGAYAVGLTDEGRAAVRDEMRRILGVGDTSFELTARAWVVTGVVG